MVTTGQGGEAVARFEMEMALMKTRRASAGLQSKAPAWGRGEAVQAETHREASEEATEMTLRRTNRAGQELVSPPPWVGADGFR